MSFPPAVARERVESCALMGGKGWKVARGMGHVNRGEEMSHRPLVVRFLSGDNQGQSAITVSKMLLCNQLAVSARRFGATRTTPSGSPDHNMSRFNVSGPADAGKRVF